MSTDALPTRSPRDSVNQRIRSIDLLRGLVIVIMALDHVRDFWAITPFSPEDLSQSTAGFFFTRWITHFCAPVFVLLSGTSAYLYALKRGASKGELAQFLLSRGLWLIIVELTLVNFSWQFGYGAAILQVIWVLGWSMIILAGLIYLPRWLIISIGLAAVLGHNALDGLNAESVGVPQWLWLFWHQSGFYSWPVAGIYGLFFGYPILPWFGVMALGYALGPWFAKPLAERSNKLLLMGLLMVVAFAVLRGFNLYGNPTLWASDARGGLWSLMALLNTEKYPPSLHYLLMTLGPSCVLLALVENWRGWLADQLMLFGKVPFFFYILHIPLIHLTALIYENWRYGQKVVGLSPPETWPADYVPSLLLCYAVWAGTILVLYWPCRWFAGIRKRYSYWWLSYL
ncbi:MAG: heparan-alpha-glucosaminide N-acetyltransferase domain-containing protein [Xanthomonadales bacterium]|nr:heparan-alpha-glucosaminide N-acetyltransferase domain-containing protein [Xanthomonadales bacterium]